jgi:heme exporter protein D
MIFQFESIADFFLMDGHGIYVWSSYAITFLALLFLVASPFIQQRTFIIQQKRQQRIEEGKNQSNTRS